MILAARPDPVDRVLRHLGEASRRYPGAWRQFDRFRAGRDELGGWPPWCFCPLSGAYAIVSAAHGEEDLGRDMTRLAAEPDESVAAVAPILSVARLGALAAWRVSQGIYVVDPTVFEAVVDTPAAGKLPCDVLMRLPEWCVYVPTPGLTVDNRDCLGFFAHLEHDTNLLGTELRLLIDYADLPPFAALSPEILHLKDGITLQDAFRAAIDRGCQVAREKDVPWELMDAVRGKILDLAVDRLEPLVSLLLYLCSQTAEFRPGGKREFTRPMTPAPKKTKDGWRLFPPDRPRVWYVGERVGRQIREAYGHAPGHHGDRAGPRPHVRGAHWHGFWSGPMKGPRRFDLRWLPPIPVAMADDTPEARIKAAKLKPLANLQDETNTTAHTLERKTPDDARDAETQV